MHLKSGTKVEFVEIKAPDPKGETSAEKTAGPAVLQSLAKAGE